MFDTSPSPLWDRTCITIELNDPSELVLANSNIDARLTSKKPKQAQQFRENKTQTNYVQAYNGNENQANTRKEK